MRPDSKRKLDRRDVNIIRFMRDREINTLSIKESENGDSGEASFSWSGCDVCDDGLGNNVYECEGYSPQHKEIFDGFDVCHECICRIYNGE